MSTNGCPDPVKLAKYAGNDLAVEDTAALERHLAGCRPCLDRCVELGKDSLVPNIPGCHIVNEIGRGRFGVVYKAWWLKDKPRIVALKVLSSPGEMERSRFEREIAVLKKIDSPWIVKCLDSGETGGATYYVMDLVQGVHLDEYSASPAHDLNEKLAVFQRVCHAVADAHDNGVVHRDLKPRNILIDADGQPHILDFGICALETPDWSSWERLTITHPGDIIGTLKYMSPEQAWGGVAGSVDERSDIWALGVMLFGIVTDGDYPYPLAGTSDKSPHEALIEHIRKELPRLPRLDHLPRGRDIEVLLERCLAWEPDHRIESAQKLADDLERYRAGRHIKTKPLWMPYRLKRLAVGAAARSRWMFSAAFIAALGVTLWGMTLLFDVGWQVAAPHYQGRKDQSTGLLGTDQARDGILVVGVFDDTIDAVVSFAKQQQITDVTRSVPTWRAVHGHLMERLAPAHPRVVVWDYYFPTPQAGDARFAAGVRGLEEAGVPVVLAVATYRQDGTPDVSPGIAETLADQLRHGTIDARHMVKRPGEFVMAIRRDEDTVIPGLALTTLAAVLHPDTHLHLDWPERDSPITMLYESQPGAYLRERDHVEPVKTLEAGPSQDTLPDDLVACAKFILERPHHWERRTVPYQMLLLSTDEQLRALVRDKLVIVGDFRTSRPQSGLAVAFVPDRHPVKYGTSVIEDVPGCYLLGDAIASLLDRRIIKSVYLLLPPTTFLPMLLIGAIGCLLPIKLATKRVLDQPRNRRLLWVALLGLSALCFVVTVMTKSYATVHVGMVGFSLLATMAGSFWVEFARNRHRVLDRHRRSIEDCRLATDGTITLAPSRGGFPPDTGRMKDKG